MQLLEMFLILMYKIKNYFEILEKGPQFMSLFSIYHCSIVVVDNIYFPYTWQVIYNCFNMLYNCHIFSS